MPHPLYSGLDFGMEVCVPNGGIPVKPVPLDIVNSDKSWLSHLFCMVEGSFKAPQPSSSSITVFVPRADIGIAFFCQPQYLKMECLTHVGLQVGYV